jgi:glycosyltransferase involved in cell wall biosynthesis
MVSVAICTCNRAGLLEKSVQSVLPQLTPHSELLIVDNASTDATPQLCARLSAENPRIRTFREMEPGACVARNLALRQAHGDWVIFLDDDVQIQPGWLAAYETFFNSPDSQKAASVGGPVLPLYEIPAPNWLPNAVPTLEPPGIIRPCRPGENLIGCNFAVRRETSLTVGGFNPRLGPHGAVSGGYEEPDLIERHARVGYQSWWLSGAVIKHWVAAYRLKLSWQLASAYRGGHCSAIRRLSPNSGRPLSPAVAILRILAAPFQFILHLLAATLSLLLQNRRKAVRSLFRASSIAGFALELVKQLGPRKNA